jgi:WD40 repeat protein
MSSDRIHWSKSHAHDKNALDAIRVLAKETFNGSHLRKQLSFYQGDEIIVSGQCNEKGWNAGDIPRNDLGLPIPTKEDGVWYVGEVVKRTGKTGNNFQKNLNETKSSNDDGQRFHVYDKKHTDAITCVQYHEPSKTLITASKDGSIRQWHSENAIQVEQFEGHPGVGVSKIFYDPVEKMLVSVASTSAKVWDITASNEIDQVAMKVKQMKKIIEKPIGELKGHHDKILDSTYDPVNHLLFTAGGDYDKTCRQWHCKEKRMVSFYEHHENGINNIDFDREKNILVTCSTKDKYANVWNASNGDHMQRLTGWDFQSCSIAIDAVSNEVFVGGDDSSVALFNMITGEIKLTFNANVGHINKMIHCRSLNQLVLAGQNNDAVLMDDTDGQEIRRFHGHHGPILDILYSPETNSLFTCSTDASAKCWDVKNGKETSQYDGHKFEILCMAYDEKTHGLVTGSGDKSARLWYWRNGVGPESVEEQLLEEVLVDY